MNTLAAKSVPILPKPIPPYSAINPTQNIFAYPLYLSMYNICLMYIFLFYTLDIQLEIIPQTFRNFYLCLSVL